MRQPAAAPLDHFCILFLREKDGGQCPQPSRVAAQWVTWSRVSRRCRKQNPERVLLPARAHLPVEDTALAGSARYQIALWHNG